MTEAEDPVQSNPFSPARQNIFLDLAKQIQLAWAAGQKPLKAFKPRAVSKILFCGLGGSAIGGDILRALAREKSRAPFVVNRADKIPAWVDRETLVIVSSYSGDTAEVLACFDQARRAYSEIWVLTSGGRLGEAARKKKIPAVLVPGGLAPRFAIGFLTVSLLPLLNKMKIISSSAREIQETAAAVRSVPQREVKALAKKMLHRPVHCYASSGLLAPAALRWRSQLAENAKTLASHHLLPEMFHNEIEGWRFPKEIVKRSLAIFLTDRGEPAWLVRKRNFARKLIERQGAGTLELASKGRSQLARLFYLISLGDRVSFELARLLRVDPVSTPSLNKIKKIM